MRYSLLGAFAAVLISCQTASATKSKKNDTRLDLQKEMECVVTESNWVDTLGRILKPGAVPIDPATSGTSKVSVESRIQDKPLNLKHPDDNGAIKVWFYAAFSPIDGERGQLHYQIEPSNGSEFSAARIQVWEAEPPATGVFVKTVAEPKYVSMPEMFFTLNCQ